MNVKSIPEEVVAPVVRGVACWAERDVVATVAGVMTTATGGAAGVRVICEPSDELLLEATAPEVVLSVAMVGGFEEDSAAA